MRQAQTDNPVPILGTTEKRDACLPRLAFTIVFNGLQHLTHNDYVRRLTPFFHRWVFVEGAAGNTGSTSWCKPMPACYQRNGHSVDGTLEWLNAHSKKYPNVTILSRGDWRNKDEMVNAALAGMPLRAGFLWQIDVDEQWQTEDMQKAENELRMCPEARTALFDCSYYFGPDLVAREQVPNYSWRRLFRWYGERFKTHEPPLLEGCNREHDLILPLKFNHYAYYFPEDVQFKSDWYGGHTGIYERWLRLQRETTFPQPITYLFPEHKQKRAAGTQIVKVRT